MAEDYIDDEEIDPSIEDANTKLSLDRQRNENDILNHVTDTRTFDPTKFVVISPEEVMKLNERSSGDPNPEFSRIINDIEASRERKLSREEYFKACDIYAQALSERDEEKKQNYDGELQINPIKKEQYLRLLLENQPVSSAARESMKTYENDKVNDVEKAYEEAVKNETKVLEIKEGKRINLRYKGKCRIASDESGKVIIIDNKSDVNLLRMKYRQEWIDKRYPNASSPQAAAKDEGYDEY